MNLRRIDINCDLGEGIGNDEAIMPYISSANIACGGHAGNKKTVAKTIELAIRYGVKIGAHPSYPDKKNFGRVTFPISSSALAETLMEQILLTQEIAFSKGQELNHIKPHGALYHAATRNDDVASLIVELVKRNFKKSILYAPFRSKLADIAIKNKLGVKHEVFADRSYLSDLSLVSRQHAGAVLSDPDLITQHVMHMVEKGKVKTINGEEIEIFAETVCVHGDHPGAVATAAAIFKALKDKNYTIG
ncbi:5-oxoprolinase subunit PxpA [Negadavirga shengliensis]|uniref:5-oxoprolinase subunit PxpA n=1 Tax=Negadavirga shengliensis TaxID=1389218 RepID=A0ABV9SZL7_9BACT